MKEHLTSLKVNSIYCDGSCIGNPGRGGWAALVSTVSEEEASPFVISGQQANTTNNRMELVAVIEGLSATPHYSDVVVYTDSQYVIKGATEYSPRWAASNWKGTKYNEIKNVDLWKQLISTMNTRRVSFIWVKGHTGNLGNEFVDKVAHSAAEAAS